MKVSPNKKEGTQGVKFSVLRGSLALVAVTGLLGSGLSAGEYVCKDSWAATMAACRGQLMKAAPLADPSAGAEPLPFSTGTLAGSGPGQAIALDVTGVKTLRLSAIMENAPCNCNIWGEPMLIAADGKKTRLTELTPLSVVVGWGQLLTDKNWQGHPLQIAGRKLEFGIWVHADSEVVYTLDAKFARFEAFVGEDCERVGGAVRFEVTTGSLPQPLDHWREIARDFPRETGWMTQDVANGRLAAWFAQRADAAMEKQLIAAVLGKCATKPPAVQAEIAALAQAGAGDVRWLELYARLCRYQECMDILGRAGVVEPQPSLVGEVARLTTAKTPASDAQWDDLYHRAQLCEDVQCQFETLQYDITQRATFDRFAAETYRKESLIQPGDRDPADIILRRLDALILDRKSKNPGTLPATVDETLAKLRRTTQTTALEDAGARRILFSEACALRRQVALSNPLLDFDRLLFIKRHRAIFNHMCDQFYGITANPGGGLYVLEQPFGPKPKAHDILAGSTVEKGRLQGRKLSGGPLWPPRLSYDGVCRLSGDYSYGGSFLSPSLSYDGRSILFSFVECEGPREQVFHTDASRGHWAEGRSYHIFKVNLDGSGLQQLTDGTWNEFDPCWLPNNRVAFISERRGGYLRCGRACPLYTLYDMAADGSQINCLSFHDSNEWNPSVTHDGRIVYTRWDYVDRWGCIAHHPWLTSLEGTDARALHGNFSVRAKRADMELCVRAVPGSNKFTATGAPHHGQQFGSLVLIDPKVADDDAMSPVKRITPDVGFPESQGGLECYGTPWPLSDDYYLCVYDDSMARSAAKRAAGRYGIYLLDSFGNKELLYRDPAIGCVSPIPLRPTPVPPVTPAPGLAGSKTPYEYVAPGAKGEASMAVINVYDTLKPWPAEMKVKSLRIYQLLPCSTPSGMSPHRTGATIAEAPDSIPPARWVLGTVPVEADGSANFIVPAYREVFFQALDDKGMAINSMRSATYARNGEQLLCMGCHESKNKTPTVLQSMPLAIKRAPSRPVPDVEGSNPFSYPLLVQPVLDRNCVACHAKNSGKAPVLTKEPIQNNWYASYNTLIKYGYTSYGGDWYRTPSGKFGARASKLYEMLSEGHHGCKPSAEDMHRITLWLDSCSLFYGVFEQEPGKAQLRGEPAVPSLQ